ncbi:hypothetical protein [Microbacterium sp. ZXX196]|uniref:hypothetical protein n=1 Tax=Microbacterium sp. ZXX196 TaxID=2609291 RepID=UPI0012BA1710|nr:hypothetical protein [Microbacterium sp. ZXX196]MTE24866.1 hypothetical protein [Microbacterium sp. ZXX196]
MEEGTFTGAGVDGMSLAPKPASEHIAHTIVPATRRERFTVWLGPATILLPAIAGVLIVIFTGGEG